MRKIVIFSHISSYYEINGSQDYFEKSRITERKRTLFEVTFDLLFCAILGEGRESCAGIYVVSLT